MIRFVVIGITDNPQPWFPPEVLQIIKQGRVFSGGRRHHEIVAPLLPEGAEWIDITVPLDAVFQQYRSLTPSLSLGGEGSGQTQRQKSQPQNAQGDKLSTPLSSERGAGGEALIVFASGDPLFFGFANTIRRKMPDAEVTVYPAFNSLQLLAHLLVMRYDDMRIVSLTGRPWPAFDRALIERVPKIGILTDKEHTPAAIAQRMLEYGYTYYKMYVGEHLGNPSLEKVSVLTLDEAAHREFSMPNCVIVSLEFIVNSEELSEKSVECRVDSVEFATASDDCGERAAVANSSLFTLHSSLTPDAVANSSLFTLHSSLSRPFGIPDSSFALLDGREKMITKMPIRLLTLQALDLPSRHVFWDIGACTGSVSIEARLQFPHLQVEAFEIRPECEAIIRENARRHGAPGIGIHIGDFLNSQFSILHSQFPPPDAVFIGGHGGHLKEIMAKVLTYLAPDGVIVMNSVIAPKVSRDSRQLWEEACAELGLTQDPPTRIQLNDHHPITILRCRR